MLEDPRIYQVLALGFFLLLGISTRDWSLHPSIVSVAILTCLSTQWIALAGQQTKFWQGRGAIAAPDTSGPTELESEPSVNLHLPSSLWSALITSLGLSLLLRTDHVSTMILAAVVAISSKFLLQVRDKHLFNPANVGIIAALSLTQDAWVSPGQWGTGVWYACLFLAIGGLILKRVGRWDTTMTFLIAYAGLEAIRNVWLGWTWDVWSHRLMSGSLLLFAFFMITDPRTIPDARTGRLIWSLAIATLTFILRNFFFVSTAPFWALFLLAPLSPLLDRLFPADRFTWTATPSSLSPSLSR